MVSTTNIYRLGAVASLKFLAIENTPLISSLEFIGHSLSDRGTKVMWTPVA